MVHQTFHGDQSFHNTSCLTVFSGHIRHNVSVSPHNRPAWPLNRHGLKPTCIPISICTTLLDAILFFTVTQLFPNPQKKEKTASFSPCIFFMVITQPTNNTMLNKMISSFCRYTPLPYSAHRNRHITHLYRSPWNTILMMDSCNLDQSRMVSEHPRHDLEPALILPHWIVRCCTIFLRKTIWSLLRALCLLASICFESAAVQAWVSCGIDFSSLVDSPGSACFPCFSGLLWCFCSLSCTRSRYKRAINEHASSKLILPVSITRS